MKVRESSGRIFMDSEIFGAFITRSRDGKKDKRSLNIQNDFLSHILPPPISWIRCINVSFLIFTGDVDVIFFF